jgi:hypothetical protein
MLLWWCGFVLEKRRRVGIKLYGFSLGRDALSYFDFW